MDRVTLGTSSPLKANEGVEYLENNCVEEPTKLCEFKRLKGKILKTVDSVYQDIATVDDCRELCLNSPFRCRSYDFGDTGEMVCRLSHHSRSTLSDIQDPYLDVPEASTYELSSCYNVSIECRAGDMLAKIKTSKLFDGKVYAKGSPNSCSVDVKGSLEFELRMGYHDIECNVRQNGLGSYLNDVVIQHHDMIVTSSDLGLALTCQYDMTNKTVSNDVDLDVIGDIETALNEEVIVDSPNVVMRITTRDGSAMKESADVGDPLALKFEILDAQSPYEIFVRELVAMDGADSGEITLIDSRGCPTDHFIMGPIYKSTSSGKSLLSHFDAFKFPSSPTVQFRALVTPCMPTCEPVQCDENNFGGELRSIISYGRKRRSVNDTRIVERKRRDTLTSHHDDMLLVQSIHINDKFGFASKQQQDKPAYGNSETVFFATPENPSGGFCVNGVGENRIIIEPIGSFSYNFFLSGLILATTVFLLAQLAVMAAWTVSYQRRQKERQFANSTMCLKASQSTCRSESRSTLFDRDITALH